jgi:hypothetical protein
VKKMIITDRLYPRECFACGDMMIPEPDSTKLVCSLCDVSENGAINGRWNTSMPQVIPFGDEMIRFVDHGKLDYPTPDSAGYERA